MKLIALLLSLLITCEVDACRYEYRLHRIHQTFQRITKRINNNDTLRSDYITACEALDAYDNIYDLMCASCRYYADGYVRPYIRKAVHYYELF